MTEPQPALRSSPDGLLLRVRVTPKASYDAIETVETGANGLACLRIRVRAIPDKGRANAAVIKLLAKALGVAKSEIELVSGAAGRIKTIRIAGNDGARVNERLRL